ncbi:Protein of unknown function [Pyronema omphalodes CBS 100304]|uniref:Uncharacterized protein n=1 Tax=Pyronema omphalodes (strain CBS 100304) TaxID=1076935 RepID=U4LPQ2_PYROM|nr:Protein of unknown function [Pyronema omphalodes CBS 100304]
MVPEDRRNKTSCEAYLQPAPTTASQDPRWSGVMSSYIHYYEVLNNSFVPPLFAEYRSFASRRDTGSGAPNYFYLSPATLALSP